MDQALSSPPRTSAAAVWSLVLGILSMFCLWLLGSIPAIILGIIALTKISAQPTALAGRGLAISGIVTGSIGVITGLVAVGMVASISMPAYNGIQERAKRVKEMADIRTLSLGCQSYASDHDGRFPGNLRELYPDYIGEENFFTAQGTLPARVDSVSYRPGLLESSDRQPMILGQDWSGGRTVGFTDGTVEQLSEPLSPDILVEFE